MAPDEVSSVNISEAYTTHQAVSPTIEEKYVKISDSGNTDGVINEKITEVIYYYNIATHDITTEVDGVGGSIYGQGQAPYETVLHEAVLARNLEKIMFYCRYPLLVNSRNNCEQTPLHYCSLVNFPEGARILINNGADINALNGLQQTPVMEGALTGSVRFVEYMLSVRQSSQIIKVKRKTICLVTKCKVNPFIKDYKG